MEQMVLRAALIVILVAIVVGVCSGDWSTIGHRRPLLRDAIAKAPESQAPARTSPRFLQTLEAKDFEQLPNGLSCNFEDKSGRNFLVAVAPESTSGHVTAVIRLIGSVVELTSREVGDYEQLFAGHMTFEARDLLIRIKVDEKHSEPLTEESSGAEARMDIVAKGQQVKTKIGSWICGE